MVRAVRAGVRRPSTYDAGMVQPDGDPIDIGVVEVFEDGTHALARLLRIDPDEARAIRDRTPSRRRPRPQVGPAAEYS